jgi:hypothetical protein
MNLRPFGTREGLVRSGHRRRRRVDHPPERAGLSVELFGIDEKRREEFAALAGLDEESKEGAWCTWRRTTPCSRDARVLQ